MHNLSHSKFFHDFDRFFPIFEMYGHVKIGQSCVWRNTHLTDVTKHVGMPHMMKRWMLIAQAKEGILFFVKKVVELKNNASELKNHASQLKEAKRAKEELCR